MKIKRIYIERYKGLENLTIFLESSLSVFIWENGTWKSRILELLAEVFIGSMGKMGKNKIDWSFEIEFSNGEIINEKNYQTSGKKFDRIIAFYAWDNTNLLNLFNRVNEKEANKTSIGDIQLKQEIFYLYKNYYNYILLSIFTEAELYSKPANKILLDTFILNRDSIDYPKDIEKDYDNMERQQRVRAKNIKIIFWFPSWWKKMSLWWAKWTLRKIIESFLINSEEYRDSLYKLGKLNRVYELTMDEIIEIQNDAFDFNKKEIHLHFNNTNFISSNPELYQEGFWILEALNLLHVNGILENLSLDIEIDGKVVNSNTLSEGERQKINIDWLHLYFSNKGTSLFLLDEPDSFLHPNWQMKLIPNIMQNHTWDDERSDDDNIRWIENPPVTFITTHSPLVVGSWENYDIVWLKTDKDSQSYIHCHTNPSLFWEQWETIKRIDVYGNRAEFIYKEVFWLESTRASEFEKRVNRLHLAIFKKKEEQTPEEQDFIIAMKKEIYTHLKDDKTDAYLSYLTSKDLAEYFPDIVLWKK